MIRGFVEEVRAARLLGWACEINRPGELVKVDILMHGALVGATIADLYRSDLQAGGYGEGNHGFIFEFPQDQTAQDLLSVEVRASLEGGEKVLLPRLTPNPATLPGKAREIVFSGKCRDESQFPVFVLGSPRSGTTAMSRALLALPRYVGTGEGHLLDLANHLIKSAHAFYARPDRMRAVSDGGTLIAKTPLDYFDQSIRSIFIDLVRLLFSSPSWVDKTPAPDMIAAAPLFRQIWPNARFIFMKRRAIETVLSRLRKFPERAFNLHCLDWAKFMEMWIETRSRLAGAALEIDQLFMAREPQASARVVGSLLALSESETNVLNRKLTVDRPEQTSANAAGVCDFAYSDWSAEQKEFFLKTCGPMMAAFNYDFGEDYYSNRQFESAVIKI